MEHAARKANGSHQPQRHATNAERRIRTDEELITLTEAAKSLPKVNGKNSAACTLWPWCRNGKMGTATICSGKWGKMGTVTTCSSADGGGVLAAAWCVERVAMGAPQAASPRQGRPPDVWAVGIYYTDRGTRRQPASPEGYAGQDAERQDPRSPAPQRGAGPNPSKP